MSKQLPSHSKPVSLVMKTKSNELQPIFEKIHVLNQLKKTILPMLDQTLQPYIEMSCDFKETLVLIVANDAIAVRLRFQLEEQRAALLQQIKRLPAYYQLNEMKYIKIKLASYKHQRKNKPVSSTHQVALLSAESAATLQMSAETVTHPALKAVMQRIATRKKP